LATEAQPAKQTKLLVVEDDAMIRMVLADMLCELGYTVAAEAASIDEALEATRKTEGGGAYERFGQSGWVEPTPFAGWKSPSAKYIDVLLTDADWKEQIATNSAEHR
jgi:CheY-like chemotaxis protein